MGCLGCGLVSCGLVSCGLTDGAGARLQIGVGWMIEP
jgi:hypothetical protein